MHVETYKEMKKTFLNLTGPNSSLWLVSANPLFSIVYDRDENTIWAGWRPRNKATIPNAVYFELTELEAQNFSQKLYDKAINTLLYKAKQENLKDKLKKIEKDFK
jgi:hypothetical protein